MMANEHVEALRKVHSFISDEVGLNLKQVSAAADYIEELERRPAVPQAVRERDRLVEFVRQHASVPCSYAPGCRCSVCRARALLNELEGDNARNPDGTPFDGCVGAPKTSREDSP